MRQGRIRIIRYFGLKNEAQLTQAQKDEYSGFESDISVSSSGHKDRLVDICCTSIHTGTNAPVCGVPGACAQHYERAEKFKKHAKFIGDDQHLTSMGFDTRGGFSDNAVKVLRLLFARNRHTQWTSDADRIWLQKRTVEVISSVIHKWAGIRRTTLLVDDQRHARAVQLLVA